MKKEYRNLSTWIEKASYLEGVLTPKLANKEYKVINVIHSPYLTSNTIYLKKIMIIKSDNKILLSS